ncbi:PREDICTED: DNA repair protein XRCC2 [Dufourea novaeangliae]|uniref:DNA repair protein XRCC2 n=1 Tax=Dufourea novaeangliae TaxID=178035 RepID=A0A154PPH7_DUFNO|nr:PREDICTED: DNA repair protein XRCC2 [Dufourea novaeangliae]KZC13344.1 DNA repair protein XRCC2 [Dufourea novaeangliae]
MRSQVESGAELFARLNGKPSLRGLDDTLFLEGPGNTDTIEINGEHSTGKTLLLSRLVAKCILPDYNGTVRIKGCSASVVLINTDHHFQVSQLIEIMTNIVNVAYATPFTFDTINSDIDKINAVRNSLRNLRIIDCYSSEQFRLTLRTLDDLFLSNAGIALLAIDSITAYYWQDRENCVISIDSYVSKLLRLVKMHTNRFNVTTIYTKLPASVDNCKGKQLMANHSANTIEYKIHLRKIHGSQNFTCILETGQSSKRMRYSILSSGIKWLADQGEG